MLINKTILPQQPKELGKFLGSPEVWWNGVPSSHIYGGPHREFNEQTLPWMWEERAPFSIFRDYLKIIQRVAGVRVSHAINNKFLTCSLQVAAKIQTLNQGQMEAEKLRERSGEEKETSTNKNSHKSKFHYFFGLFLIMFFLFYKIFLILKIDKFIFLKLEIDVACWFGIFKYYFNKHVNIYYINSVLYLIHKIFPLNKWW